MANAKRTMSPAARAAIGRAMKANWVKRREHGMGREGSITGKMTQSKNLPAKRGYIRRFAPLDLDIHVSSMPKDMLPYKLHGFRRYLLDAILTSSGAVKEAYEACLETFNQLVGTE